MAILNNTGESEVLTGVVMKVSTFWTTNLHGAISQKVANFK
jgi:hypothetical protein